MIGLSGTKIPTAAVTKVVIIFTVGFGFLGHFKVRLGCKWVGVSWWIGDFQIVGAVQVGFWVGVR